MNEPSTHVNGPVCVGDRVAVPVVAAGTVHGVLMWWELTVRRDFVGRVCTYTGFDGIAHLLYHTTQPYCQHPSADGTPQETYSTIPRDPATDPLWQDHWKPCAWALPHPTPVAPGQAWGVQGAHDDTGVWVDARPQNEKGVELREGPAPCACGLHLPGGEGQEAGFPLWRIRELNDEGRYVVFDGG